MSIRRIIEALSDNDYRVTWQRWAVAAHIALKGDDLFTVEELYTSLKKHYPDIGLTTVYRTLDLLVDLGIIARVHGDDGMARYSMRQHDLTSQQTFYCSCCGELVELATGQLQPLLKAIASQLGFALDHYELRLSGTCQKCIRSAGQK